MTWGGLPMFIYDLEREEYIARLTGAMAEEYNAGWTRSTPDFWIRDFLARWDEPEYQLYSLGVRIG